MTSGRGGRRDGGGGRPSAWAWPYLGPAAGLATVLALAATPRLPFGPGRWPLDGPFGAFTWAAWAICLALAVSVGTLGFVSRLRGRGSSRPISTGRTVRAAVGFLMLAGLAYLAAARVDLIRRSPLAALALAVAAAMGLRALAAPRSPEGSAADGAAPEEPAPAPPRERGRDQPPSRHDDTSDDEVVPTRSERWARRLSTAAAALLVAMVVLGAAVRWLGPAFGVPIITKRPAPIFWGEPSYFAYLDTRRDRPERASGPFYTSPEPGSVDAARRAVLPIGARLAIKRWMEGGAEVRVESDPTGKLEGRWGYVRLDDVVP